MGKRILLAEDNRQLAETLADRLTRHGFKVELKNDGIAALKSIASSPPDLLLLDLKLPGLHGIELLKKLRQSPRTAQLPVIILTGVYKGEKFRQAAKPLGVNGYLEKPFKAADLMQAIQHVLPAQEHTVASNQPLPFARHLRAAFLKRFSGQLTLSYPDTVRTLVFINGAPVALRPGYQHRDFGHFLLTRQLISDNEYDYFTSGGGFRHDCLVQIGCLEYSDLLQAEMDYLENELVAAFGTAPATATWKTIPATDLVQLITLNVPQLFYDGFHRHPGTSAKQLIETFRDKYVACDQDYFRHINFLRLNDTEKHFLHDLDGRQTLAGLMTGDGDFGPLLLTLTSLNMLRFGTQPMTAPDPGSLPIRTLFNALGEEVEIHIDETLESFTDLVDEDARTEETTTESPPADKPSTPTGTDDLGQEVRLVAKSLEGQNHYQVFGIKPAKFSIDLLKERYFAMTRKFGPEVLMQLGGEEAVLVEEILSKVATAYDTLSDIVKKERYDEMLGSDKIGLGREGDDRFQAEVQAESGKVFLDMGEWDNAEKALQEAVNFDANNGDYLANLAWAIYRNPKYASSQAMQNKAKQMLNKALTMQKTAQGFAYKGWILFETGQDSLAEAEFNKALKLDARHQLTRKGLRTLQEKREQQKKGLFKRMFK